MIYREIRAATTEAILIEIPILSLLFVIACWSSLNMRDPLTYTLVIVCFFYRMMIAYYYPPGRLVLAKYRERRLRIAEENFTEDHVGIFQELSSDYIS